MFSTAASRLLRLIALSTLLSGAHAFAQFEIAPDHFDSEGKKTATHSTAAKNKAVTPAANAARVAAVSGKTGRAGSLPDRKSLNQDSKGGPIPAVRKKSTAAAKIAVAKPQAQ